MAENNGPEAAGKTDGPPPAKWYYADKGVRTGPVTRERMEELVRQGAVTETTSVWPGAGEWRPARDSELAPLFVPAPDAPPPLPPQDIDNRFAWAAAAVPLAGTLVEEAFNLGIGFLYYLLLNSVLCFVDEKRLKAAGHKAPESGWAMLVPVYLWRRASLLGHQKHYFWCWIAAFAISLLVGSDRNLEQSFMEPANRYLASTGIEVVCRKVTLDRRLDNGNYQATASLSDGTTWPITVWEDNRGLHVTPRTP